MDRKCVLNEVTWEQRVMEDNPKFEASQYIPDFAYAKFGEMLGFKGIFVDTPDRLACAWQEALSSERPVVLEVKTEWHRVTEARAASSATPHDKSSTGYSGKVVESAPRGRIV